MKLAAALLTAIVISLSGASITPASASPVHHSIAANTRCHNADISGGKKAFSYIWIRIRYDHCRAWPHGFRARAYGQCLGITGLHWHAGNWITRSRRSRNGGGQLSKAYCSGGTWNDYGYQIQFPHHQPRYHQVG